MTNGELLITSAGILGVCSVCGISGTVIGFEARSRGLLVKPTPTETPISPAMLAKMTPVAELPVATGTLPVAPICGSTETPTPTPTPTAMPKPTETPKPRPIATEQVSRIKCEYITDESLSRKVVFEGLPVKAVNVLTSSVDKMFKTADWNRNAALNLGFSEPGGLSNPDKIRKIDKTPFTIQTELQGWTKIFLQEATLEWKGQDGQLRRVALPEKQGRTFGVYLREFYDTDGNKPVTVKVDCNISDHGQTQHIDRPYTAFVSEGQLGQESASVFTGKNYNAATGQFDIPNDNTAREEFTVVVVDMNTGAYTVATQKGLGQPFVLENQNWK